MNATDKFYRVDIPSYIKDTLGRSKHEFAALVPHDEFDAAVREDPTFLIRLDEAIAHNELPQAYFDHRVVRASSEPVVPFSLFADGAPHNITDRVIGFWLINEITTERILVAALRKKLCCFCGCCHWCTYHEIFALLLWSFRAMADGISPDIRHDTPNVEKRTRRGPRSKALQ
jgi:hypothetical protein